jgi:hypothetical protein
MSYPTYESGKTAISADDLNRMIAQLRQQSRIYVAPPLNAWYDSRGLTLRLNQLPLFAQSNVKWSPGLVFSKTTDANGLPLYIFQPVTLNTDGTITNPGKPSQFVRELNNNPLVTLPTYQWIWQSSNQNVFNFDLETPPARSAWSSDFSIFSAPRAIPFGKPFGNFQTIPTRLFLTLSSLYGCANLNGTLIQLDLQEIQCLGAPGAPGLYGGGPCATTFTSPGGVFNRDVCSVLSLWQLENNFVYSGNAWAWYGGLVLPAGAVLAAALIYTPGNFLPLQQQLLAPPAPIVQMVLASFDRLALQLWLFYTPFGGGAQVVFGPAYCDSYYFPAVGGPYNGMNAGVVLEDLDGGGAGIPSYGSGYSGRFAATFVLGWNTGGPCQGDVLALVQGDAEPVYLGDAGNSTITPASNFLIQDGAAGCDSAFVTIS